MVMAFGHFRAEKKDLFDLLANQMRRTDVLGTRDHLFSSTVMMLPCLVKVLLYYGVLMICTAAIESDSEMSDRDVFHLETISCQYLNGMLKNRVPESEIIHVLRRRAVVLDRECLLRALHAHSSPRVIEAMLEAGVPMDGSALFYALQCKASAKNIDLLLLHGAPHNSRTFNKAIHLVASVSVIKTLLYRGVPPSHRSAELARRNGYDDEIVALIQRYFTRNRHIRLPELFNHI